MAPCKTISLQQMSTGSSPTPGNASSTLHSQGSCVPVGSGTCTPLSVPPLSLMWPWCVEDRGGHHSCLRCRARHYHTVALGEAAEARIESARKAVGGSLSFHSTCGGAGKDVWRGFWNTHSGWLKDRILPSVYCLGSAGIIVGKCVRVLQPVHWFIAHGRAWASILWKSFPMMPSHMFQATPGWMRETAWFSGTCIPVQVYLVSHSEQINHLEHLLLNTLLLPISQPLSSEMEHLSSSGPWAVNRAFRWGGVCSSDVLGNRLSSPWVPEGTHGAELRAQPQTCTGYAVQAGNKLLIWKASLLALCILDYPVTQKKSQLGPPNWGGRRLDQIALLSAQGCCFVFFFNKYFMNLNLANIGIFFLI